MEAAKARILLDIALVNLGALALGLIAFQFMRSRNSEIGWHHHGNVWTEPFDRIDLGAAKVLILFFLAQVLLLPMLVHSGSAPAGEATSPGEPAGLSFSTIIVGTVFNLILGGGVFAFATTLRGRNPVQLFGLDRLSLGKIIAWSFGGLIVAYIVMLAVIGLVWKPFIEPLWGEEQDLQGVVEALMGSADPMVRIAIAISAVLFAPLVEEVIFRGFLYPVIKRYSDRFFAAVTTALLFALIHANVPTLLPLFALAIILTIAYELTGCLWVPIAIHALFNASQTALMFLLENG